MALSQLFSRGKTIGLLSAALLGTGLLASACGSSEGNGDGPQGGGGGAATASGGGGESSSKGGGDPASGGGGGASDGGGGSGGQGGSVPACAAPAQGVANNVTAFCDAVTDSFCGSLFGCCADTSKLGLGKTEGECKQLFPTLCTQEIMANTAGAVGLGNAVLDTDRLGACLCTLEGLKDEAPGCKRGPVDVLLLDCAMAFVGQLGAEDACEEDGVFNLACSTANCAGEKCSEPLEQGDSCGDPKGCDIPNGLFCMVESKSCQLQEEIGGDCGNSGETTAFSTTCKSLYCSADDKCVAPSASQLCTSQLLGVKPTTPK